MIRRRKRLSAQEYIEGVLAGNRILLSQAITLIESELDADRALALQVLDGCIEQSGNSIRVGITGVPGVGKSTFIDSWGEFLVDKGYKLAVLAIDPSSAHSKGSILGDKTRMNLLSQNPHAFVRPSPNSGSLGGVARKTRESMLLCEAAGFDLILIETVGVGQSELAAKGMTDFFLLLMLPNAGDELQGIKRGIMEMADGVFVNKADHEFEEAARKAKSRYAQAMRLLRQDEAWQVPVLTGSALHKKGLDHCLEILLSFKSIQEKQGNWLEQRKKQQMQWFTESIERELLRLFKKDVEVEAKIEESKEIIESFKRAPDSMAQEILQSWIRSLSYKKWE